MAGIQSGGHQPPSGPQQSILPPPPGPGAPATAPRFSPRWLEQRLSTYPRRTRVLMAFCIIFLPTVGLLAALLVAGQSTPSSSTQSVPGAASLVNVTVQLLGISCQSKTGDFPCYHRLYIVGALVAPDPGSSNAPVLSGATATPPMKISSGANVRFKPQDQIIFAGKISATAKIMGGLIAYDTVRKLDTSMFPAWSQIVAKQIKSQLQQMGTVSGNLASAHTDAILDLAATAWVHTAGLTVSSTGELARQPLPIPDSGIQPQMLSVSFTVPDPIFGRNGEYTIYYQITSAPMASAARPMSEQEALTRRAPAVTIGAIVGDVARPGRIITNTTHPEPT